MRVIIMQGASGSGKSTHVQELMIQIFRDTGITARVCSADHFFMDGSEYKFDPTKLGEAHASCMRKFTQELVAEDNSKVLIVDNTNTSKVEMAPYVAVAAAYGATVEIVRCVAPADVCASRNAHGVPAKACKAMVDRLEKPAKFWDVKFSEVQTN
jgi:tRNA uridine 5-carbamoylmethylation protein Kti12